MGIARDWYMANVGIKGKETRELVMLSDSEVLSGTGYYFKILSRGRVIIQPAPYIKEWRRAVRHSKNAAVTRPKLAHGVLEAKSVLRPTLALKSHTGDDLGEI